MRVAGDDLHLHNEYLRNCWYVAAWSADAPLAHFRRVLAQLIAQERGTALAA
jgi:hypothetical protein